MYHHRGLCGTATLIAIERKYTLYNEFMRLSIRIDHHGIVDGDVWLDVHIKIPNVIGAIQMLHIACNIVYQR